MLRWLNRAGTLLLALTVVVVPPTAALLWALHTSWRPSRPQMYAWLQDPPPEAAVVVLIGALAAALWLLVTTLVIRTMTRHLAHGWRRFTRLPLPTPAQATAGSLAGTALLGLPTTTITTTPEAPPPSGSTHDHTDRTDLTRDTWSHDAPAGRQPGVELPDNSWIPAGTAHQVAAMTGLFWLRRRQTYRPGDPPAPPAPPAASAVTARADTTSIGPVSVDQLPVGHIAVTGAGAHAAARGLLVTALMTPSPTPVIITIDDWRTLLGDTPTDLAVPGLTVTDDILTTLQQTHHTDDRPTAQTKILHLTQDPTRRTHPTVDEARLTTVTFDAAPAEEPPVWRVDADGHLTAHGEQRRLCVLSRQTAHDLLTLIALTHQPPNAAAAPSPTTTTPPPQTTDDHPTSPATTEQARPAHLSVLGTGRLTIDGAAVPIRRSAAWQILVLLATRPDGATSHELVAAVWPGLAPASISRRLYTTLSDLRTQLRPRLDGGDLISRRADRYTLDPAIIDVDLWRLHAAAHTAAKSLNVDVRHHAQQKVIDIYTGDLAAGHTWQWLAEPRDTVRRTVVNAYVDLAAALPPNRAVELLTDAGDVDPYNEHLHRLTTDALTAIGDHAAATRRHHTYTSRLIEALSGLHGNGVDT